jgi:hypothetical protein
MGTVVLVLIVVALVLAAIDVFRTRGEHLTAWAAVALAVALLVGRV